MKAITRLLANPTAVGTTNGLKPATLALLPPIPLYRRLLRAHRKHLPHQMQVLGDEYVKSEFRAHRNVDNPMHIVCPASVIKAWCYGATSADCRPTDRLSDRVADVCPKDRRRLVVRREVGQDQDRQDEWYKIILHPVPKNRTDISLAQKDQQLGQLYDLMQAIQEQGGGDDP